MISTSIELSSLQETILTHMSINSTIGCNVVVKSQIKFQLTGNLEFYYINLSGTCRQSPHKLYCIRAPQRQRADSQLVKGTIAKIHFSHCIAKSKKRSMHSVHHFIHTRCISTSSSQTLCSVCHRDHSFHSKTWYKMIHFKKHKHDLFADKSSPNCFLTNLFINTPMFALAPSITSTKTDQLRDEKIHSLVSVWCIISWRNYTLREH